MVNPFTAIRNNPNQYPITNIRWTYGVAFFIAPAALVGLQENNPRLALGGAGLGLGVCLFMSLFMYGVDRHDESRIARATLAGLLTALALLVVGLLSVIVLALGTVLGPLVLGGVLGLAVFAGLFAHLG